MADVQTYYDSSLTGAELDAALKKLPQVDEAVQQARAGADLSRSWAEGGTGLREGEDSNNARYWCGQAQTITQGALGWYADEAQLTGSYPTGSNGQWAIIGSTDTIWTWDEDTGAWVDTGAQTDLSNYYTRPQADARFQLPVGYIFDWAPVAGQSADLSTPEKVAQHFGYGTWQEITGRFTFGRDASHEVGSTGGEEKHALTQPELPTSLGQMSYWSSRNLTSLYEPGYDGTVAGFTNTGGTFPVSNPGGGQAHNNMPPYLAVYKWQRIA